MRLRGRLFRLTPASLFGTEVKLPEFVDSYVTPAKLVVLGETHGVANVVGVQRCIQEALLCAPFVPDGRKKRRVVTVVMEHFSMEMQPLLDQYLSGALDFYGLKKAYQEIGTEGHDLDPYYPVLHFARLHHQHQLDQKSDADATVDSTMSLQGGFIPRSYARLLMKEGASSALAAAKSNGFVSKDEQLNATDEHYDFFESLLTGRDLHSKEPFTKVEQKFRKMFVAQVLKDASMAHVLRTLLQQEKHTSHDQDSDDRILAVCGVGHMLYSHGVPERIFGTIGDTSANEKADDTLGTIKNCTLRVACLPIPPGTNILEEEFDSLKLLTEAYGGPENDAADICFAYDPDDDFNDEVTSIQGDEAEQKRQREETRQAYDKVGSTAHLGGGDYDKARAVMSSLGYTEDEIQMLGPADAVNYQGVGCPHRHANLKQGEIVLDVGSGLGIDSILAAESVGETGRVTGIDLSKDCVTHARGRAKDRKIDGRLKFAHASIERVGSAAEIEGQNVDCYDVILSNGAFCLVPNKRAGFAECFRLLKPGGRIVICTTTLKRVLQEGVEWPLCMQTFAMIDELEDMVRGCGFEDVVVDMSDSSMTVEVENSGSKDASNQRSDNSDNLEGKDDGEDGTGRFKVHNRKGQKEYSHLKNFDMDALCARVVVKARKP